jgi:hypothetical protein
LVVVGERHAAGTFWERVDVGFEVGQESSDYFVMIIEIGLILKLFLRDNQVVVAGPLRRDRDRGNSDDRRDVGIQVAGVLAI